MLSKRTAAVPINGTNEVQTLTLGGTPTGGTFNVAQGGADSGAITWNATTATIVANIQAGCDAIFGSGNTLVANSTLSSGIGAVTITFQKSRGAMNQGGALTVSANNLTGTAPTVAVAVTTPGVWASDRGASAGDELVFTGAGCNNTIETLTIGGSGLGGTFTITGQPPQPGAALITTGAITWSATNATLLSNIQTACDTAFGSGNTTWALGTITSGIGTLTCTMTGTFAFAAVPLWTTTSSLTGTTPTVAFAITTAGGVSAGPAPAIPFVNNSNIAGNPNWVASGRSIKLPLGSPALGTSTAVHAAVSDTGSTQTITTAITNPDVPRCIVATPGGTTANVTAVSCSITGADCNGNVITETLPAFTAASSTAVTSVNAFATVTSISQPAIGTSVTVSYGTSPKLGLGLPMALDRAERGFLNSVRESTRPTGTAGSNTISKNLVQLSSALNGSPVVVDAIPY